MKNPKFQIFKSTKDSQFYFRLRAANGEIILGSEGYVSKQNCQNGIASVKINAQVDQNYRRRDSPDNFTFNLHAKNNEIIGRSENYKSSQGRENGIDSVKREAVNAPIEDIS